MEEERNEYVFPISSETNFIDGNDESNSLACFNNDMGDL